MSEWVWHLLETAITVGALYLAWKAERKKEERSRDKQHAENRSDLGDIKKELQYFPSHMHVESEGNYLTVDGIRYPKKDFRQ